MAKPTQSTISKPEILPNEVYASITGSATVRKKRSLEILHKVCQEQHKRGSVDYSIATIGRLSAEAGGPATQSIRNKEGREYRELIAAWSTTNTLPKSKKQLGSINQAFEKVLELIPDASAKAFVGLLISENRKLKGENALLKDAANVIIDKRPNSDVSSKRIESEFPSLLPTELDALRAAIADENLKKLGWVVDPATGRVTKNSQPIFKAGFATAILKLTSL